MEQGFTLDFMINQGDVFQFLNYDDQPSLQDDVFYDESLKRWTPVGSNTFTCVSIAVNPRWVESDKNDDTKFTRALYFSDGNNVFCTRVVEDRDILFTGWYRGSTIFSFRKLS